MTSLRVRPGTLTKAQIQFLHDNTSKNVGNQLPFLVLAGIVVCVAVLSILKETALKKKKRRFLTAEELDDARVLQESQREEAIRSELERLEKRLRSSRMRKAAIASKVESDRLLEVKLRDWNDRGRVVYGDAWDEALGGNLPMKEIFSLPENEVKELKMRAFNEVKRNESRLVEAERVQRETARSSTVVPMGNGFYNNDVDVLHGRMTTMLPTRKKSNLTMREYDKLSASSSTNSPPANCHATQEPSSTWYSERKRPPSNLAPQNIMSTPTSQHLSDNLEIGSAMISTPLNSTENNDRESSHSSNDTHLKLPSDVSPSKQMKLMSSLKKAIKSRGTEAAITE